MTPKARNKRSTGLNTKKFCASKNTFKKVKKQPTEWENIFADQMSNKEFVSRVYKELSQLNNKMTNNLV